MLHHGNFKRMVRRGEMLLGFLAAGILFLAAAAAQAHPLDVTYATVTIEESRVRVAANLTARQAAVAFLGRENNFAAGDFAAIEAPLLAAVREQLTLAADGAECRLAAGEVTYDRVSTARLLLNGVRYAGDWECRTTPAELTVTNRLFVRDFPEQRNIMVFAADSAGTQHIFTPAQTQGVFDARARSFHFTGAAATRESLWSSIARFIQLGVEHVAIGYDHIAFIIGIHLVIRNVKEILKIVTSFTIAHSITLTLATLGIVELPSALVEAAIALTIVYIGVENIIKKEWRNRWRITFGLGLIHGLGFSSVLRGIGIPQQWLIPDLVGFNVGVEIGQLVIIAILVPALLAVSRWPRANAAVVYVGSIAVSIAGLVWFLQRVGVLL